MWCVAEACATLFLHDDKVTVKTFPPQLDKDVLTDWSIGGCKENSTTLIKTTCAKKIKNITTELTTTATTTMVTGSTTEASIESCLTDPDGTCHFLFYDTSLTDTQIGIILLIASLVILCTALIIIVKILNSMMKGRYLTPGGLGSRQQGSCMEPITARPMHFRTLGLVSCSCL